MKPPSTTFSLEPRYSLLTVAYLAVIYGLSSIPGLGAPEHSPLFLLVMNLGHAPLFAGFGYCVVKSLQRVGQSWARYALTLAVGGVCAALDEWHQSFVPGRTASLGDWVTDLAGIGLMLCALHLYARGMEARSPAAAPSTPCPATGPLDLSR
jgi:VanZ family protein